MAFIDRDSGPGGIPEMPMLPEENVLANITELPPPFIIGFHQC